MTLATSDVVSEMMDRGLLSRNALLKFRIEADTIEEAKAVQHIKMGWPPFRPNGKAAPCPISAVRSITRRVRESAQTAAGSVDLAPLNSHAFGYRLAPRSDQNNSTRALWPEAPAIPASLVSSGAWSRSAKAT